MHYNNKSIFVNYIITLGTSVSPNMDVFLEKCRMGWGGVISDPKNYIADFVGFKAVNFGSKFWKNVQKTGGGGGQGRLDFFQKNIHLLEDGRP